MSEHYKNTNQNEEKETPIIFVIGILLICFALIPLLYGLIQSQFQTVIFGGIAILIGLIFFAIGYLQIKKQNK
ncbi:MAG: hypothetical protein A2Y34_14435 [Spirochaetes bacterium GWC1_27_15]|nr:MAG: hypothetical protein A2Z98_16995 [Spirochaetes bacterium GWB1_27_13]OHD25953.1 MAG: hypothetical protein A2Y34_14435 [Spirochaetes bacterium GWC1_27_15]